MGEPVVVKLYVAARTPLFANDPAAERAALDALAGSGLAPRPVASLRTAAGPALIYAHVPACPEGPRDGDPLALLVALRAVHAARPPAGLPTAPSSAAALRARLDALAPAGLHAAAIVALAARAPDLPAAAPRFIHGDPAPANAVIGPHGACLIDWQCPALGDPAWDLSLALSPAMRRLSGLGPLAPEAREAALAAYAEPKAIARQRALAPLHAALIAAHCLWRAARGDGAAAEAAGIEVAAALTA